MEYQSYEVVESATAPGVQYVVAKMSFGRRVELARQIRELAIRKEFLAAGESTEDKMAGALVSSEIDRIVVSWGLIELRGLQLDGLPATPDSLGATGPEELFQEALAAVRAQCGLSDAERKN